MRRPGTAGGFEDVAADVGELVGTFRARERRRRRRGRRGPRTSRCATGNPSAADEFSIVADLIPGAGSTGGRRDRACHAVAGRRDAPAERRADSRPGAGEAAPSVSHAAVTVPDWGAVRESATRRGRGRANQGVA